MKAELSVGDVFEIYFVWRIEGDDVIRVFYKAEVVEDQPHENRYMVVLREFVRGRQEAPDGTPREKEELAFDHWRKIFSFVSNRVQVAYEAQDGRPLYLRLATLTGEHTFFERHNEK